MLQNQVLNVRGAKRRTPYDPRTAALAVAAAAAALLTMPVPPDAPPLTAGLRRPSAVARSSSAAAPAAAVPPVVEAETVPARAAPPSATADDAPSSAGAEAAAAPESAATRAPSPRTPRWSEPRPTTARFTAEFAGTRLPTSARRLERGGASLPAPARSAPSPRTAPAAHPFRVESRSAGRRLIDASLVMPRAQRVRGAEGNAPFFERGRRPDRAGARAASARRSAETHRSEGGLSAAADSRPASRPAPHRRRSKRPRRAPKPAAAKPREPRRPGKFHPLLLSKLLGRRALTPPPAALEAPPPPSARPARDAEGRPVSAAAPDLSRLDFVDPLRFGRDRSPRPHWDGDVWHDGRTRGLSAGGAWLPLRLDQGRWWAFAGGGAQLRHDGVWWAKARGVWFVVHEGRLWARRSFQDWDAEGLFQPDTGTEMVYSRDFTRAAVITPGEGAEVYDAATGESLGRIPETLMPPRRRPRRPAALELEPGGVRFDR